MRHSLLILPAAGLAAVVAALALPALAETKSFKFSNFDQVASSAGVRVILKQGPYAISVEEPHGKFDELRLETRGSKLVIGRQNNNKWFGRGPDYTVTVTAPSYKGFEASSGSHIESDALKLGDISLEISSGAHVELAGSCKTMTAEISSGSHFSGADLKCESATVEATSGAHAEAWASAAAHGEASSGANITFHGKPATFEKDTSSGGSVKSL